MNMAAASTSQSWTMVYTGSYASVLANQATLEASGIETFIPDSTTKVVDPFITGGSCLDAELHVQHDDAEEAALILNPAVDPEPWDSHPARVVARDPLTRNVLIMLALISVAVVLFLIIAELTGLL